MAWMKSVCQPLFRSPPAPTGAAGCFWPFSLPEMHRFLWSALLALKPRRARANLFPDSLVLRPAINGEDMLNLLSLTFLFIRLHHAVVSKKLLFGVLVVLYALSDIIEDLGDFQISGFPLGQSVDLLR